MGSNSDKGGAPNSLGRCRSGVAVLVLMTAIGQAASSPKTKTPPHPPPPKPLPDRSAFAAALISRLISILSQISRFVETDIRPGRFILRLRPMST